jgi:uncharacterized protein (TIGR02391 family)
LSYSKVLKPHGFEKMNPLSPIQRTKELPNGQVLIACPFCQGTSHHPAFTATFQKCPVCDARGELVINASRVWVACKFCKGSGHDPNFTASPRPCPVCKGYGVPEGPPEYTALAAPALECGHFHSEIEKVSGKLFRDGHYKQAALEAFIRVINEVRVRSGLALDGDPLMNHAFGFETRQPIILFSPLQTDADRDEQRGFLFLFKGIVGHRNMKAHSNRLFDNAQRGHDYLSLASLLLRVLEVASVNIPPERT